MLHSASLFGCNNEEDKVHPEKKELYVDSRTKNENILTYDDTLFCDGVQTETLSWVAKETTEVSSF